MEEVFGWTFVQDTRYHKALFIVGPSGIGKSTVTDLLGAIHGEASTSGVARDHLTSSSEIPRRKAITWRLAVFRTNSAARPVPVPSALRRG